MKEINLKTLKLRNFKGIKALEIHFHPDKTLICGRNATGKSTVFDAFTWLLFGKDSHGNSDTKFSIKPVTSTGKPMEKLDHEVEAVFSVSGEEVVLRRCYTEDWVKPRGSAEQVLKGHTTAYFYNGVPMKESEYKAKINGLIEEQLFKLLTNPFFFASLDWGTQREILLTVAGGVSYEEIAASKIEFANLLSQLSGKDIAEFKTEISARKKKLQEELDKIPTRIDEVTRSTPEAPDFDALEAEKERLTKVLEEIDNAIGDKAKAAREHYDKVRGLQSEINGYRTEQQNIVFAATQEAQKKAYETNAVGNQARNEYDAKKREFDNYVALSDREIADLNRSIETNTEIIAELECKIENKRKEWHKRNEETYQQAEGGLICPIYKTLCSDASVLKQDSEAKAEAKKAFEDAKKAALTRIHDEGVELNKRIEKAKSEGGNLVAQLNDRTTEINGKKAEYSAELERLNGIIQNTPTVEVDTEVKAEELPAWLELEDKIAVLVSSIEEITVTKNVGADAELTENKRAATAELDEVKRKLSLRWIIEQNEKRIAELQASEKDLAQQKADLEKQEFVIEGFTKARMEELERRVNQKFQLVRFKMFSQQINGGLRDTCEITMNGVKYLDLNNAGKIQAGLDIIRTLQEFNQVKAPIFSDNAESVNEYPKMDCQMIFLRVTDDKELVVV